MKTTFAVRSYSFALQVAQACRAVMEERREYIFISSWRDQEVQLEHCIGRLNMLRAEPTSFINLPSHRRNEMSLCIG
jgi:hypothetical protein